MRTAKIIYLTHFCHTKYETEFLCINLPPLPYTKCISFFKVSMGIRLYSYITNTITQLKRKEGESAICINNPLKYSEVLCLDVWLLARLRTHT